MTWEDVAAEFAFVAPEIREWRMAEEILQLRAELAEIKKFGAEQIAGLEKEIEELKNA